jgi:hypothetical protein
MGRIFGPERDEVTRELRKLHNEEFNDLYCSPNIVRMMKWRKMRWTERGEVYTEFWWGKTPLGRPRRRWEDNIKMGLQEVGCGAWAGSIWLRIGTDGGHL